MFNRSKRLKSDSRAKTKKCPSEDEESSIDLEEEDTLDEEEEQDIKDLVAKLKELLEACQKLSGLLSATQIGIMQTPTTLTSSILPNKVFHGAQASTTVSGTL